MLFEVIDYAQALQVMFKAAEGLHAGVERILPGVAEGRVAQIMRQRNGLGQVFVEIQLARDGTRDLRDFQAVGEPRAKEIALVIDEHLRFVLQSAKGAGVNNAIAVALKFAAALRS